MKKRLLRLAVLSAIGISMQTHAAAGFVAIPDTGFAGSAYTNCFNDGRVVPAGGVLNNAKGNFGASLITGPMLPSASTNNTCWVAKPLAEAFAPIAGYVSVGSNVTNIPTATGAGGNIGTIMDRVWRNSSTNMCIIGTRVTMNSADHDSATPGTQLFEVNDIARGGFADSGTVNVAYTIFSTAGTSSPVFRVGRTFTSVQHRPLSTDNTANGTNYLDLPTIGGLSTLDINGETVSGSTTSPAKQTAAVNSNWIDFTIRTYSLSFSLSPFLYIEAPCLTTPTIVANAIRLRQTGMFGNTLKEISIDGFVLPGAVIP
jgi:hypothetical protein